MSKQGAGESRSYRGSRAPTRGSLPMDRMSEHGSSSKPRARSNCFPSVAARSEFLAAQGNPDQPITVYRGMPSTATTIHPGDWVSTVPGEAAFLASMLRGHVVTATVPASTLFYATDSMSEWGYDGNVDVIGTPVPEPLREINNSKFESVIDLNKGRVRRSAG